MSPGIDPNDPSTWPIADAVPADVFLGERVHDCTPQLTDEQKSWPATECEPTDAFLDPALVVDLTLRPNAEPSEYVYGTAVLLRALSAQEEALGGSGLVLDARQQPAPEGKARLVLHPKTQTGAQARFQKLADLLTGANPSALPSEVVGAKAPIAECRVFALAPP